MFLIWDLGNFGKCHACSVFQLKDTFLAFLWISI